MYRNLLPVGRHYIAVPKSLERIYSQVLKLTRYENQHHVIYRLAHKKVNKSKDHNSRLFDQLKTLEVQYTSKFRKGQGPTLKKPNYTETKNNKYLHENNIFNVIRPERHGEGDTFEDRLFHDEKEPPEEEDEEGKISLVLSRSVTPELEEKILNGIPNQKCILKEALLEIEKLEKRNFKFILPKSMTVDEWRTLISLQDMRSRTTYVHSLVMGTPSLDEIQQQDKIYQNPLQLDPELLEDVQDEEGQRKIKIFLMEHEMLRQDGEMVPYLVTEKDIFAIADLKTSTARTKLMMTMLGREMRMFFNTMRNRQTEVQNPKLMIKKREQSEISYDESSDKTIVLNYNPQTINLAYDWSAVREFHDWGIPLVIDMSYTSNCELDHRLRQNSLLSEILNSISINKEAKTPFQLQITNIQPDLTPKLSDELSKNADVAPYNLTSESHLDMYPHDRLVYLSPDSRNNLVKFNPDDIYVIGGIVDKQERGKVRVPLTLPAAKKLNIRHARFPTRQVFGVQSAFNIDTCVGILNDIKETSDWFYSLRWLPQRILLRRLHNDPNPENELLVRAHRRLSPADSDIELKFRLLNPTNYRYYFKKIMECKTKEEMENLLSEIKI